MVYKIIGNKKIYLFAVMLGLSLFLGSLNNPGKALAYASATPGSCGVDGTISDYAGLVVGFGAQDDWNNNSAAPATGYSNVTARVNTASPSYQNKDNTDNGSGNGFYNLVNNSDGSLMNGTTFDAINKGDICGVGTKYMAILGNLNPTADTNNKEWQLDCDFSIRKESPGPQYNTSTPYQEFGIFPSGTPDGLRGGGFWTVDSGSFDMAHGDSESPNTGHISYSNTQRIGPRNGLTGTIVFIYHEPANPPTPQPSGTTQACNALSYSGGTATIGTKSYQLYGGIDLSGATIYSAGITQHISSNDDWYVNPGTNTAVDGTYGGVPDGDDPNQPASNFVSSTGDGVLIKGMNATIIPNAQYVSVTIDEYYWDGSSWVYYDQITSTSPQCYQSGCYVESITGDLPDGYIKNGGTVTVKADVPNYSIGYQQGSAIAYLPIPQTDGAGNSLVIHTNKGDSGAFSVPANGSTQVTFTFTAPSTGTTDSFSGGVEYNNGDFWVSGSTDCSGSYDIYQPPTVSVSVACDAAITGSMSDLYYPVTNVDVYADGTDDSHKLGPANVNVAAQTYSYNVPSSLQDGQNHTIYAIARDPLGVEDSSAASVPMKGCAAFTLAPGANGAALSPNFQQPTSFDGTATVTVTYGSGVSWPSGYPGVSVGTSGSPYYVKYTFTKNGSTIQSGSVPAKNNDGYFINTSYSPSAYTNFTIGSYSPGDKYCINVTANPLAGFVQNDGKILSVTTNGPGTPQTNCDTVHNEPYAHFFGNDVTAGGGFGNNCPPPTAGQGGIYTYSYDSASSSGGQGSGTQFGAQALDVIEGFDSALLRSSSPSRSTGLTFANTSTSGSPPGATMGGKLGLSNYCVPDYYGNMPSTNPLTSSPITSIPSGAQNYTGSSDLTIKLSGNIGDGNTDAIYVSGHNVYIKKDIKYANTSWTTENVSDIPSFYLVVKGGNIYIDPGVKQLDGVYVAQPDTSGNGGIINTCATSSGSVAVTSLLATTSADNCSNQLTVNGAFVAQKVFLDRSYSSLRYSKGGDNPRDGLSNSCGNASYDVPSGGPTTAPDCAAEIFDFSPELYLTQPASKPNSGPTTGKFDYVTSLSPVL